MPDRTDLYIHVEGLDEKSRIKQKLENTTQGSENNKMPKTSGDKKVSDSNVKSAAIAKMGVDFAVGETKQIARYGLDYIGDSVGDKILQARINNGLATAGQLGNIASATAAGAMVGGPWGALAGAVIGIASEAVQMVQRAIEYEDIQIEHKFQASRSSERLGIITCDRNRR